MSEVPLWVVDKEDSLSVGGDGRPRADGGGRRGAARVPTLSTRAQRATWKREALAVPSAFVGESAALY